MSDASLASLVMSNGFLAVKCSHGDNTDTASVLGKRFSSVSHDKDSELESNWPFKRRRTLRAIEAARSRAVTDSDPWHYNDTYISLLDPETFFKQVNPSAPFPLTDSCPIHPIFQSVSGLSQHIPLLVPTLRLATRLLTSRHTLPFIQNLIFAPITQLQEESMFYGKPILHLPVSPHQKVGLPPAEHRSTTKVLLALCEYISIVFGADDRLENTWAFTTRTTPPQYPTLSHVPKYMKTMRYGLPRQSELTPNDVSLLPDIALTDHQRLIKSLGFAGTNAQVQISSTFLRTLHPDTYPKVDDVTKIRAMVFLADTLVHEIVHAVWICRVPPPATCLNGEWEMDLSGQNEYEPFIGGDRKAELGHSFEASIFDGGILVPLAQHAASEGKAADFQMGLGWLAWPDAGEFFVRSVQYARPVPLARLDDEMDLCGTRKVLAGGRWNEVRVIAHQWIARMFRAEFWERVEVEGKQGLLRVGREVCCRSENVDWGCVEGGLPVDWEREGEHSENDED